MFTELTLTTKKQSKGRNGWFRAATAEFINLFSANDQELASGDPALIAVDISSAKENRAAPIQLYFTPEDARQFAETLLAHAGTESMVHALARLQIYGEEFDPTESDDAADALNGLIREARRQLAQAELPKEGKTTYTVIGHQPLTGEVVTSVQVAEDPHEAMAQMATEVFAEEGAGMDILCAIKGDHETVPACEDAGKSADVADLAEEAEA